MKHSKTSAPPKSSKAKTVVVAGNKNRIKERPIAVSVDIAKKKSRRSPRAARRDSCLVPSRMDAKSSVKTFQNSLYEAKLDKIRQYNIDARIVLNEH